MVYLVPFLHLVFGFWHVQWHPGIKKQPTCFSCHILIFIIRIVKNGDQLCFFSIYRHLYTTIFVYLHCQNI